MNYILRLYNITIIYTSHIEYDDVKYVNKVRKTELPLSLQEKVKRQCSLKEVGLHEPYLSKVHFEND